MIPFESLVAQLLQVKVKELMGESWKVSYVTINEVPKWTHTFESPPNSQVKSFSVLLSRGKEIYEVGKILEFADENSEYLATRCAKVFSYAMKHPSEFALVRR